MVRVMSREIDQRVFKVKVDPKRRSQTPIQPFFDIFQTHPVITPSEWISSKS
jgi:hypothetical protein